VAACGRLWPPVAACGRLWPPVRQAGKSPSVHLSTPTLKALHPADTCLRRALHAPTRSTALAKGRGEPRSVGGCGCRRLASG